MAREKKRFIIIDSNSIIHRAYHALPPLTTKKGEAVGAIYGFLLVLFKTLREFKPDFMAACFDFPAPTFRSKIFKAYKAKRPRQAEELYQQINKIKELLATFGISVFEKKGFEADDIIGTIAAAVSLGDTERGGAEEIEIVILSGDLDTLQLINHRTKIYILRKGVKDIVLYDEKLLKEKFDGLTTEQFLDFKALRGDPSDNIPGVKGIGEKTATKLLLMFGTLEALYKEIEDNSEKIKLLRPKVKETLLEHKEDAFLSKTLSRIEKNVPIIFNLNQCRFNIIDKKALEETLKSFEFYSLIERLSKEAGGQTAKNNSGAKALDAKIAGGKSHKKTKEETYKFNGRLF